MANPMKQSHPKFVDLRNTSETREGGRTLLVLLLLACLLVGFVGGAFWLYRRNADPETDAGSQASSSGAARTLSDGTRAVLESLTRPVEVRYYALLDPATTPETLRAYAGRVDELLTMYERNGSGKLTVSRRTVLSDANADDAAFEGIRPFNLDQGVGCYLGLAVANQDNKELMSRLSPEWEPALESDLSRMIERLGTAKVPDPPRPGASKTDPAKTAELKQLIPNLGSVSLSEGTELLRAATLRDLTQATKEMEVKIQTAQQKVAAAQNDQSEARQQAAMREIQQLQMEQTARLQEIAQRFQDQITLLEYLKSTSAPPGGSN
jgi:hypothetical protein